MFLASILNLFMTEPISSHSSQTSLPAAVGGASDAICLAAIIGKANRWIPYSTQTWMRRGFARSMCIRAGHDAAWPAQFFACEGAAKADGFTKVELVAT